MQTKQDHAYQELKARIAAGTLLPGQRIVVNRFAQEIGTSAIPVREALLRLEAEGLVTITPHVGAVVTHITSQQIEMTLETLAILEGYATRLAAPKSRDILGELERLHHEMEAAAKAGRWDTFSKGNRQFHFTIYSVVDNTALTKAIEDLWSQLDRFLSSAAFFLMPDRALGSVREHGEILSALRAPRPDLDAIEALARRHKMNTARRLRPRIDSEEPNISFARAGQGRQA